MHEQLIAFTERFGDEQIRRARELHVTPYQLLIVASMVEREAQLPGDRAKVAAVIYNRLRLHMALGIDATIRYALNDYTQPLTAAQLALDSPYNTRTHLGLPPTPISNPGDAAIDAAAHPAHVVLPLLRRGRRRLRRAGLLHRLRPVRTRRRRLPRGAARERRARPDLPRRAIPGGLARMPRLGVLGWPVAHSRSPAMHNAALGGPRHGLADRRAGAISCCRSRPSASPRRSARSRPPASSGRTSRSPTSTRRSRSPTPPARPLARSARRTRSRSPPTARSRPRTPTLPASSTALGVSPARA